MVVVVSLRSLCGDLSGVSLCKCHRDFVLLASEQAGVDPCKCSPLSLKSDETWIDTYCCSHGGYDCDSKCLFKIVRQFLYYVLDTYHVQLIYDLGFRSKR